MISEKLYRKVPPGRESISTWSSHNLAGRWRCAQGTSVFIQFSIKDITNIVYQLYCQNLSLFGKLFIDVKTLFFDCDNCEQSPSKFVMLPMFSLSSPFLYSHRCEEGVRSHVGFFLQSMYHISSPSTSLKSRLGEGIIRRL